MMDQDTPSDNDEDAVSALRSPSLNGRITEFAQKVLKKAAAPLLQLPATPLLRTKVYDPSSGLPLRSARIAAQALADVPLPSEGKSSSHNGWHSSREERWRRPDRGTGTCLATTLLTLTLSCCGNSSSASHDAIGGAPADEHHHRSLIEAGGFRWQQTTLWKPSYAWTPNSHWTSGSSPAYLGQANGSDRNFLDQQYSEGYSVVPGEYDSAYVAGEQIENTYRPHGYGNQGVVVRTSRPAVLRRRHQQKLPRTPCLYTTPISSSIPFGYLITDHYHGAMPMVGMSHQQAMNNKVLMIEYWKLLVRSHAAVRRISQQQAMDEIVGRLGISTSCLTTGVKKKKKTEIEVIVEHKQQQVKSQAEAASLGDDKKNRSFVVLDFKATCWDRNNKDKDRLFGRQDSEIIEFSSVLVDAATGHTKSPTFHKYVIPTENHALTEYCMIYNGIKQEDVQRKNGAVMLSEALHLHLEWIGKLTNWNSTAVVVTWGDWDCRTMLKQECFRKNLHVPDYFTRWINLKAPFAEKYGAGFWNKTVKDALEATEVLQWEGAITGGRSHAHNKARLLSLLIEQGAKLDITGCLVPKKCI